MMLGICHFLFLGSAFFRVRFILKIAEGYVIQTSFPTPAEREHLFPDSSSKSSGLVSQGPKLGQAPKPIFVTDCPDLEQFLIFRECGEGKFLYVCLFV